MEKRMRSGERWVSVGGGVGGLDVCLLYLERFSASRPRWPRGAPTGAWSEPEGQEERGGGDWGGRGEAGSSLGEEEAEEVAEEAPPGRAPRDLTEAQEERPGDRAQSGLNGAGALQTTLSPARPATVTPRRGSDSAAPARRSPAMHLTGKHKLDASSLIEIRHDTAAQRGVRQEDPPSNKGLRARTAGVSEPS
ncbi:hypothetical protein MHYP_G00033770 [Metynnis hypsauchen]